MTKILIQKEYGKTIYKNESIEYEHLLKPKEERSIQIGYCAGKTITS